MKLIELRYGVHSNFELGMRFAKWCESLPSEPTLLQVRRKFHIGRSTAYRWLDAWRSATKEKAA